MMYTQQIKHLPFKKIDDINSIAQALGAEYAYIVHDKDLENGKPVEEHVHAMLHFKNAHSVDSVAKSFGDSSQSIEKWDGREENGFAYLIHHTKNSFHKFQYDICEVTANFDYAEYIVQAEAKAAKNSQREKSKHLLDAFKEGHISKDELERILSGSEYGKLKNQIESIHSFLLRQEADDWRKEAIKQGKTLKVLWCYGDAGTGKTSFAKEQAKKYYDDIYISGSSKDLFQSYRGQHVIILDDLRPNSINYQDLLRILDPRSIENSAFLPSRYYDKALACELIIITTPYSPYLFYANSMDEQTMYIDSFDQLYRRITLTIYFDSEHYYSAHYNALQRAFKPDKLRKQKNVYSTEYRETHGSSYNVNDIDLYGDIFCDGK